MAKITDVLPETPISKALNRIYQAFLEGKGGTFVHKEEFHASEFLADPEGVKVEDYCYRVYRRAVQKLGKRITAMGMPQLKVFVKDEKVYIMWIFPTRLANLRLYEVIDRNVRNAVEELDRLSDRAHSREDQSAVEEITSINRVRASLQRLVQEGIAVSELNEINEEADDRMIADLSFNPPGGQDQTRVPD